MRSACAQLTFEVIGPGGGGYEIGAGGTRVLQLHGDERIALGLDGGAEVIVGDLGYNHVTFLSPPPCSISQANTGEETGQESGDFDHDRGLLSGCVTAAGGLSLIPFYMDIVRLIFVKVDPDLRGRAELVSDARIRALSLSTDGYAKIFESKISPGCVTLGNRWRNV
jgi:hypothetical protein